MNFNVEMSAQTAYNLTMRSNSRQSGQNRPTFIEEARRRQIVDTAIETIAARGFSKSSLAEIARAAGISKGVISYYFEGKSQLVEAILARVLREPAEFIKKRVDEHDRPLDKLGAYIRANFEHMKDNRNHYIVLVDLWDSRSASQGDNPFNAQAYEPSRKYLMRILESGREAGEMREVVPTTMASIIQAAIDGVMLQWIFDADAIDLDASGEEVLQMITNHVVSSPAAAQAAAVDG
jgi:TetR/AcrR family fatty acid metabolism transcriptional regulator